jgi:hypothetical protein
MCPEGSTHNLFLRETDNTHTSCEIQKACPKVKVLSVQLQATKYLFVWQGNNSLGPLSRHAQVFSSSLIGRQWLWSCHISAGRCTSTIVPWCAWLPEWNLKTQMVWSWGTHCLVQNLTKPEIFVWGYISNHIYVQYPTDTGDLRYKTADALQHVTPYKTWQNPAALYRLCCECL